MALRQAHSQGRRSLIERSITGTQFAPHVVDAFFRAFRRGFGERADTERATLEAVG